MVVILACACAAPKVSPPPKAPEADRVPTPRALRLQARAAYYAKDWRTCAALFARVPKPYEAAACSAQAGQLDAAFAQLQRAVAGDLHGYDPAEEGDFEPLHADPRWADILAQAKRSIAEHSEQANVELAAIYIEDQADRHVDSYEQIDWNKVRPRDIARRQRVSEILAAHGAVIAADFFAAAMVFQHGETPDDIQRAHDLAVQAVQLDPEHDRARWLAAASEDRKLSYENKPQKWGTQYKKVDGRWIVWPCDPSITDAERDDWNVPPLAHAQQHAAEMNAKLKK